MGRSSVWICLQKDKWLLMIKTKIIEGLSRETEQQKCAKIFTKLNSKQNQINFESLFLEIQLMFTVASVGRIVKDAQFDCKLLNNFRFWQYFCFSTEPK